MSQPICAGWGIGKAGQSADDSAVTKENRCPACGPVRDGTPAEYCPTHRRELIAECERYVARWAAVEVARTRVRQAA